MTTFVLTPNTRENVTRHIGRAITSLFETCERVRVTVEEWEAERSEQQNRALWGLAYSVLAEHTGHTPDQLHDYFCRLHFGTIEYEGLDGKVYSRARRSTTRNEQGARHVISWRTFSEFYESIYAAAADMGVVIPSPDPEWRRRKEAA